MLRAIVGVELTVGRLEGKYKLSQNQDEATRQSVRNGLAGGDARAVAGRRDGRPLVPEAGEQLRQFRRLILAVLPQPLQKIVQKAGKQFGRGGGGADAGVIPLHHQPCR